MSSSLSGRDAANGFKIRAVVSGIGLLLSEGLNTAAPGRNPAQRYCAWSQAALLAALPPAAAAAIFSSAWSIVNEAAFCRGGNSLNVARNGFTMACAAMIM